MLLGFYLPAKGHDLLDSPRVVQNITHRINSTSDSIQDLTSTNDRSMVMRVIKGVQRLLRRGLKVTIAIPSTKENAGERARTMARQRGRKACKSHRQLRLLQSNISPEEQDLGGD
jgi:hypothetical protein